MWNKEWESEILRFTFVVCCLWFGVHYSRLTIHYLERIRIKELGIRIWDLQLKLRIENWALKISAIEIWRLDHSPLTFHDWRLTIHHSPFTTPYPFWSLNCGLPFPMPYKKPTSLSLSSGRNLFCRQYLLGGDNPHAFHWNKRWSARLCLQNCSDHCDSKIGSGPLDH